MYPPDIFMCTATGYVHVCNVQQCQMLETLRHESTMICAITGMQYPLRPIATVERDHVDFGSTVATLPKEPTRPGPRRKEATTSRDTDRLVKTATAILDKLVGEMAALLTTNNNNNKDEKDSNSTPSTEVVATYVKSCLESWNYVTAEPSFGALERSKYTFEKHCLVVVYFAKEGFRCQGFEIPQQPWFEKHIVPRSQLGKLKLTADYTSTVRLFREFISRRQQKQQQQQQQNYQTAC